MKWHCCTGSKWPWGPSLRMKAMHRQGMEFWLSSSSHLHALVHIPSQPSPLQSFHIIFDIFRSWDEFGSVYLGFVGGFGKYQVDNLENLPSG